MQFRTEDDINIFAVGILLIPSIAILFIFGVAIGIATTALVFKLGPPGEWFAWSIPFLFTPISAVFYPVSALPAWLQPVAAISPPAYVFEGMRGVLLNGTLDWTQVMLGIAVALVYLVIASLFLWRVYRSVLRTGSLARFSAEIG